MKKRNRTLNQLNMLSLYLLGMFMFLSLDFSSNEYSFNCRIIFPILIGILIIINFSMLIIGKKEFGPLKFYVKDLEIGTRITVIEFIGHDSSGVYYEHRIRINGEVFNLLIKGVLDTDSDYILNNKSEFAKLSK